VPRLYGHPIAPICHNSPDRTFWPVCGSCGWLDDTYICACSGLCYVRVFNCEGFWKQCLTLTSWNGRTLQQLFCNVGILYGNSQFVVQQVFNLYCAVFDVVAHVRNLVGSGFITQNVHGRLSANNENRVYFFCFIFTSHTDKTLPYNIVCFKILFTVFLLPSHRATCRRVMWMYRCAVYLFVWRFYFLFFFTGTFDLKDRPLVVVDSASVVKASVAAHEIASLLLYYATLPR